jgi:hypothetical protein
MAMMRTFGFALLAYSVSGCSSIGEYHNDKGDFSLSWCYPSNSSIQLTMSAGAKLLKHMLPPPRCSSKT